MIANPFICNSPLNAALDRDICQRIHYAALQAAARGQYLDSIPGWVSLDQLRHRVRWYGPTTYLLDPADIERIFTGVTLAVYQTIIALYASRLERSIGMTMRMIKEMAEVAGVPPIDDEAIWAICAFAHEKRSVETTVTMERSATTWWLVQLYPDIQIQESNSAPCRPSLACVLDTSLRGVMAFRIGHTPDDQIALSLALYDALVIHRRPAQDGAAGLRWFIPDRVVVAGTIGLDSRRMCAAAGIDVQLVEHLPLDSPTILTALQGSWARDFTGRVLQKADLAMLFDTYLYRICGYSPLRVREQQTRKFAGLTGYNRDPTWQFPALRWLLPEHRGVIEPDGTVVFDGLHYVDRYEENLLVYWPGHQVTLRRSEYAESAAWIYLDGEILGLAKARELRRNDGSYRSWRAVR